MKTETTKKCLFCQSEFSSTKDSLLCDPCQEHANNTVKGITSLVENFASIFETEAKKVMSNFEKTKRINDFWVFSHAALWPNQNFSHEEIEQFKSQIAEYFDGKQSHNITFEKLVECAIQAHASFEFLIDKLTYPAKIWFNKSSQNTQFENSLISLYNNPKVDRIAVEAKVIAVEILNYSRTNDINELFNYRNILIHLELCDYLPLYYQAVYHFQNNKDNHLF